MSCSCSLQVQKKFSFFLFPFLRQGHIVPVIWVDNTAVHNKE